MILETEEQARAWVADSFNVPRETLARLDAFVALLREENERQNLVSRSTLERVWVRHIADSAQLLTLAPGASGSWLDLGSGAGFPGLIAAVLQEGPVTLVESRKLRVAFLEQAAELLGVAARTRILLTRIERAPAAAHDVISARAFAALPQLLDLAHPFSTKNTIWLLPKGRSAQSELEAAQTSWQGEFRLVPSLTDPDARIIVAEGVCPRRHRGKSS